LFDNSGMGGKWQVVTNGQKIRVTSKLGKVLRILVRTAVDCDWNSLRVQLFERSNDNWILADQQSSFAIDSKKLFREDQQNGSAPASFAMQLELKLFLLYRSLSFLVQVVSLDGIQLETQTVEILTHNSGLTEQAKKKEASAADTLVEDIPEASRPSKKRAMASSPTTQQTVETHTSPYSVASDTSQQFVQLSREDTTAPGWNYQSGNLQVEGAIRARAFIQYSDIRLKTNIEDLVDAMSIVSNLKGKSYEWKPETLPAKERESDGGGKRVIGLIAQEVQRVLPQVVHETEDGLLSVNYAEIVPVLIEAFKQHAKKTEEVQENIRAEVQELREAVAALHTRPDDNKKADVLLDEFRSLRGRISSMTMRMHKIENAAAQETVAEEFPARSQERGGSSNSDISAPHPAAAVRLYSSSSSVSSDELDSDETASSSSSSSEPRRKRKPKQSKSSDVAVEMTSIGDTGRDQTQGLLRAEHSNKHKRPKRNVPDEDKNDESSAESRPKRSKTKKPSPPPTPDPPPASSTEKESPWGRSCRILFFILVGVVVLVGIALGIYFGVRAARGKESNSPTAPINWSNNVVVNPGFETVGLLQRAANWQGNDYTLISPTAPEIDVPPQFDAGRYVLRLNSNSTLSVSGLPGSSAIQVQSFSNGGNITAVNCSIWVNTAFAGTRLQASAIGRAYLGIILRFTVASVPDASYVLEMPLNVRAWQAKSAILRVSSSASIERATIALFHENLTGRTYWDNVSCVYTSDTVPSNL
jgi:hypothetical protein